MGLNIKTEGGPSMEFEPKHIDTDKAEEQLERMEWENWDPVPCLEKLELLGIVTYDPVNDLWIYLGGSS